MKRYIAIFMCLILLTLITGCGDPRTIDGITYDTWGLINKGDKENPDVQYKVNIPSIVVAVLLVETIIVPAYILGFNCMEPVGAKDHSLPKGAIGKSTKLAPVQGLKVTASEKKPENDSVY